MLNVLVLVHSYVVNLRRLCEDEGKPHQWENPTNARGKVRVHMHGYPCGTVKMLTAEVEAGLFIHYKTCIVCQIGCNDCSGKYFDKIAFETDLNWFQY